MTEDAAKLGNDKDSGINITIKKREDGYEIVGKDEVDEVDEDEDDEVGEEEKPQNSIHFKDDSSLLNVSENVSKTATIVTKENVLDTSKYSKDHSILKLQIADEDEIIDIEEDLQINSNKSNEAKQSTPQKKDKVNCSLVRQNSNVSNMESVNNPQKVSTLKQMCEKILNDFQTCTNASATNDKHQEICREKKNRLIDQENIQNISQKVNYKNKRELRSSNRRQKNLSEEFEYSYGEACTTESDLLLVCGYCHEQFGTNTSYNNHQCTVEEGKSFDEFSLQLLCFYCNETLSNYADFDQHVRLEHFDALFHCYQCTERFDSDRARLKHFYAEHNDMRCRFCNKKLSISLKVLHEGYHLGFGYPCHKCKKAYSNKKNLSYHKYTRHPHGADNLVTCTLCLKQIKVKTFRGHMATHKDNACHFCGKVFSNRTGIEYHTMIYHGTNSKLKCNVCDARFMNKKLLEKHEKMDGCNSDARKKESAAIYGKSH